jgi:hypothetical protein
LNLEAVDSIKTNKIKQKLLPKGRLANGHSAGLILYYKYGKIEEVYYTNADHMPAIFDFQKWPQGGTIRQIAPPGK